MTIAVKLEIFEGPLDLLLHLIRKEEVDIYDIDVSLITAQYLEYLNIMRSLNIEVAGEFLVMAATLAHIKSRLLLPSGGESDEEEEDPRADLVGQLREYARLKEAASQLDQRPWLDRDIFARGGGSREVDRVAQDQEPALIEVGVFELIEAFRRLMSQRGEPAVLDLPLNRISQDERMSQLLELLRTRPSLDFSECFQGPNTRDFLIVTFLALLELTRVGLVRLMQERLGGLPGSAGPPSWGRLRVMLKPLVSQEADEA